MKKLTQCGVQPSTYIMDNEAAVELKQAIIKHHINYQLTQPHIHCINEAERAIRTFKNHFLSGLATVDPTFPINEWDQLIPQAELTLNLLCSSQLKPKLSAHAFLHGNYNFNRTPLAPPGTRVVIHTKLQQRESWGFHGEDGFYVGPAPEHYRCVQCLVTKTRRVKVSDTVQFFPRKIQFPTFSFTNRLTTALNKIVTTLSNKQFQNENLQIPLDTNTKLAIHLVANILHHIVSKQLGSSLPSSRTPPTNAVPLPRVRQKRSGII